MITLLWLVVGTLVSTPAQATASDDDGAEVVVTLFWMEGCPHCEAERAFLAETLRDLDNVLLREYEVSGSAANRELFRQVAAQRGFEARAVPVTIIGEQYWIGFSDPIGTQMADAIRQLSAGSEVGEPATSVIDVPGVGDVELDDRSLLVSTLLIGFVDGFNPCSLWVLSMLMALVLHSGSRRRVMAVGAVFLTITTALYGLYIIGVYGILSYVSYLTWIQRGVAVVAGVFGLISLMDYFWPDRGVSLSISDTHRPGLYRRMRALGRPDAPIGGVLTGTAALAVGVSLVETPCTAGFPILWTDLLAARDVSTATAVALFAVYMGVFLVDELLIFTGAVITMRAAKLQEVHGRMLKLVAGVVMVALAITMAVDPARLESVSGTLLVFGGAGVVVALVAALDALRHRHHLIS